MHKNWVVEKYDQVLLACKFDEDDSHSKLLIDLIVTLRPIYRKQTIVATQ